MKNIIFNEIWLFILPKSKKNQLTIVWLGFFTAYFVDIF